MIKLQQHYKALVLPIIFVLCSFVVVPVSYVSTNGNEGVSSTSLKPNSHNTLGSKSKNPQSPNPKAKTAIKPRDKSVLDAEVLASPIAYLKNALSPEEEEKSESDAGSGDTIVIAVKALVATLLSTIL